MTDDIANKPNAFIGLNLLDSTDINDVLCFTHNEITSHGINPNGITVFDFYSMGDLEHADKWPHPQFDYKMHQLGFRFEELPKEVDIAVFGCSFTFGLGLPVDMLWHSILAKELNMTCANFGYAGASVQTIIDIFLVVSKHVKIKKAIFLFPPFSRFQIAKGKPDTSEVVHLNAIPGHKSELCKAYGIDTELIYKALPEEELTKICKNAIYQAEYVAKNRDIDIYFSVWDEHAYYVLSNMKFTHATMLPKWMTHDDCHGDLARDNMHPGPKHHRAWVNDIKHLIK